MSAWKKSFENGMRCSLCCAQSQASEKGWPVAKRSTNPHSSQYGRLEYVEITMCTDTTPVIIPPSRTKQESRSDKKDARSLIACADGGLIVCVLLASIMAKGENARA